MTAKQIAVVFGVPKDDMNEFEKIINKLEVSGKIYIDDSKRICVPNNTSKFVCKFEAKSKGFGFARVLSDKSDVKDICISKENTNGAFDEDIVLVEAYSKHEAGKRIEGKILKIIKRGEPRFVGVVEKNDSFAFVSIMDKTIDDVYIP
jgi:ribonuclease R